MLRLLAILFGLIFAKASYAHAGDLCQQPIEKICASPSAQEIIKIKKLAEAEFNRLHLRTKTQSLFGYCYNLARKTGHLTKGCGFQIFKAFEQKF